MDNTIRYDNLTLIRDNIYEAEVLGFGMVTLKMVDPNDRDLDSYDISHPLDKQYVLHGYNKIEEQGTTTIIFEHHVGLEDWMQQNQLVIGNRLNQALITILRDMFEAINYLVSLRKLGNYFDVNNVVVVNGRGKITKLWNNNRPRFLVIRNRIADMLERDILHNCHGLETNDTRDFELLIEVLRDRRALHDGLFRAIHRHPLLLSPSFRTSFRLVAYTSAIHYSHSMNSLGLFLLTLSYRYPCTYSSWTGWIQTHNHHLTYSQELINVLRWRRRNKLPSYRDIPWDFFIFSRNLVAHDNVGNDPVLDEELNTIWPGFLGIIFSMLLVNQIDLIDEYGA